MLDVELITSTGDTFLLTGTESTSHVLSPYSALVELRAKAERSDLSIPGNAGVLPGQVRYGAIQTELEFYLQADDGEQLERVYKDLRQGWRLATRERPCTVKIESDHPLCPLYVDLVVDGSLPGVPVDMRRRTSELLTVPVVAFRGLARTNTRSHTGTVTVTNPGDVLIYPRIRYTGAGGDVTSPSGAKFTLPTATQETVVDLDPKSLRLDGVFPEGVAPGAEATWVLPAGVRMEWESWVADPWA